MPCDASALQVARNELVCELCYLFVDVVSFGACCLLSIDFFIICYYCLHMLVHAILCQFVCNCRKYHTHTGANYLLI